MSNPVECDREQNINLSKKCLHLQCNDLDGLSLIWIKKKKVNSLNAHSMPRMNMYKVIGYHQLSRNSSMLMTFHSQRIQHIEGQKSVQRQNVHQTTELCIRFNILFGKNSGKMAGKSRVGELCAQSRFISNSQKAEILLSPLVIALLSPLLKRLLNSKKIVIFGRHILRGAARLDSWHFPVPHSSGNLIL